jgi:hypothetical protein
MGSGWEECMTEDGMQTPSGVQGGILNTIQCSFLLELSRSSPSFINLDKPLPPPVAPQTRNALRVKRYAIPLLHGKDRTRRHQSADVLEEDSCLWTTRIAESMMDLRIRRTKITHHYCENAIFLITDLDWRSSADEKDRRYCASNC